MALLVSDVEKHKYWLLERMAAYSEPKVNDQMSGNKPDRTWPPTDELSPCTKNEWLSRTLRDRETCLSFLDAHLRGVLESRDYNDDESRSDLRSALVAIGEAFGIYLV